eukprot:PITA_10434
MVDPTKIAVIVNLDAPRSIKQLCAMLGNTRYYRKFIKSYAQITMPIEKLLKKHTTFFWDEGCWRSLDVLKETMATAPILLFLDWKNEFHIHVEASCTAFGAVLTQVEEGEMDHPIAFTDKKLSKAKKNYSMTKHERLEMVYVLQKLMHYLLVGDNFADIIHFFITGMAPEGYTGQQKKELVVCTTDFLVTTRPLYKIGVDEIFQRYVPSFEQDSLLTESHVGATGGHYAGKATAQKILHVGLWWPTLHKDSKAYCKACDACQRTHRPS